MDSGGLAGAGRVRRRLRREVGDSLRDLSGELSMLNQQVAAALDLRAADLGCLDLIGRHGPLTPSALARLAGIHPATMTGVLDRLERGGWVRRERDRSDRRAVSVRGLPDRAGEVFGL